MHASKRQRPVPKAEQDPGETCATSSDRSTRGQRPSSYGEGEDRDMGLEKKGAWRRVHEAWSRGIRDGPCTSRMYLCWAFFIMGPLLEDRSMTSETQIMTGRVGRMLVSLKEYPGC